MNNTLVFTGNNEGATIDGDFVPGSLLDSYGLAVAWVAFTTTECSDVVISYCGSTAPFLEDDYWNVLSFQCPADELVITQDYNNGECADGQPTVHFSEVAAGTYYYPVWSEPGTAIGDYVISISATACEAQGVVANAGPDQQLCTPVTSTTVAANVPEAPATGTWSVVSGSFTIVDPSDPNTQFMDLSVGANIAAWTVDDGAGATTSDEVAIYVYDDNNPAADAGPDQQLEFPTTTTTMSGDTPVYPAIGTWSVVGGSGMFTDANSSVTTVSGLSVGENVFMWTIDNGPCGMTSDEVTITVSGPGSNIPELLPGGTLDLLGNNEGAMDSVGLGFTSAWEAFALTECANVVVDYCSTDGFTLFASGLYSESPGGALIPADSSLACANDAPIEYFGALQPGTYWIAVQMDADLALGDYAVTVAATACTPEVPTNDLCEDAIQQGLSVGDTLVINGDNTGALDNDGVGYPAVWESFTLTQCANVTVDLCGTDPAFSDYITGIYADCPATMLIDTTSAGNCADGNMSATYEGLAPGTYWVPVIMTPTGASGAYTMHFTATDCAGPANNYCNGAELHDLAVGDTLVINGDNTGATDNEGLGYASVWESFTITECADVELSYCGTDPVFAAVEIPGIYTDCPATDLVEVSNFAACADGNLIANFEGLAAGTYWIPVMMVPDVAEGPYVINVSATACPIVITPPNDLCEDVIPNGLSVGDAMALSGDNTGATDSEGLGYASVWEAITIAECANVTVDYCDADPAFNAFAMGIYADCPATQFIPATATDTCANGNMALTFDGLTPGTYWIPVLMDPINAIGEYTINVAAVACDVATGPVNDLCSSVLPHMLAVGDTLAITGDNTGATDSEGLGYANVWEAIAIPECATVTLDYCSTDTTFTTFAIGIYSDCPVTQLIQPSSTDTCASGNLIQTFEELPAGNYWIPVLMDTASAVGVYTINVTAVECEPVVPPANNLCAEAATITVVAPDSCAVGAVIGDNVNATRSGDMPTCADPNQDWQDVWYTFNAGDADEVTITLEVGTIGGAGLEVFAACGDSSLACSIDGAPIDLAVLTDSTYHVRIFTQENGTPGTFVLCVTADNTTGVSSMDRGTVHLYPNPGTGDFNYVPSVSWTDASITVLDMTGRTVHTEQANLKAGEVYQLSLAGKLKVGSYLLHVTSPEGSSIVKLMVK